MCMPAKRGALTLYTTDWDYNCFDKLLYRLNKSLLNFFFNNDEETFLGLMAKSLFQSAQLP